MKTLIAAAALAGAAALIAAPAFAAPNLSVGYAQMNQSIAGTDINIGILRGTVGYDFTPNLGVEAEAGFGVKDESIGGQKIKIDNEVAAYAVGKLPINPNFGLQARIGYGSTKLSTSGPFGSASDSTSSWNYGVGAEYSFDGKNGVRGEYTRYDSDNDNVDVWSIAYVRHF